MSGQKPARGLDEVILDYLKADPEPVPEDKPTVIPPADTQAALLEQSRRGEQ